MSNQYISYLIHLINCVLKERKAVDMPKGMDLNTLIGYAKFHKLETIVYKALLETDRFQSDMKAKAALKKLYSVALTVTATQGFYLEKVEKEFEKNGIDYLLLKGRNLACLYPTEDLRQSADFDIYIGKRNVEKCNDIMTDIGFSVLSYYPDIDEHDEYKLDRWIICELHKVLIQNDHPWKAECEQIVKRLKLKEGTEHCYEMDNEDFYVYNLAHTAKHMKFRGIGIRAFIDMELIYLNLKDKLDNNVLEERLKNAQLFEFNKNVRALCEYWFEGKTDVDEKIIAMALYVAQSGMFGTDEQQKSGELAQNAGNSNSKKVAKLNNYFATINSPYESMVKRYPILEKHRWLMPFCRIHRALRAVLKRRDLIKSISHELEMGDVEKGKEILKLKKDLGL